MKRMIFTLAATLMAAITLSARTLIVYYSFTNNTHTIVTDLRTQLPNADVARIEPTEEGIDYAANGYAIGSALIAAIRENPDDAASYPEIKPVTVNLDDYDDIIVAAPLWWSQMAAPMQTYLFHNGARMAGKRIGLIVSSASSGISGVEADAHRLIPGGNFVSPSLWIRSSQTSNCHEMTAGWLEDTGLNTSSGITGASVGDSPKVRYADGMLTVCGQFDTLRLYDLSGRLVLTASTGETNVSQLPRGIYTVKLKNGQEETAGKIVIR